MKIKKHKIKILSDSFESNFVVDLRSKNKSNKKIIEEKNINYNISGLENNFNKENLFKHNDKKNHKFNNKRIINIESVKKTFLFPLFLLFYKFFKIIFSFFIEWGRDIANFLKKVGIFKKINKEKKDKKFFQGIKEFFSKLKRNKYPKILKLRLKDKYRPENDKKKNIPQSLFTDEDIKKINKTKKRRSILWFVLFLLLLIIPFKIFNYYNLLVNKKTQDNLKQYSIAGLENFISAGGEISDLNLSSAQNNFFKAGENFLKLDEELNKIDEFVVLLASFSKNDKIKLASESKKITKIGIYLASAGDNLSLAVNNLIAVFSENDSDNKFSDFCYYTEKTKNDFKKANKYLKKIKEDSIPEEYRNQFNEIKKTADALEKSLVIFLEMAPELQELLGVNNDRRYLVIFQNNAELRATGGFIGSYALIDIKKGKISNIEIPTGGSYDTEGGMKVLVESPQPLHLVKPIWYFWDANWWPDWRMSARNLMWFYEKSGGPSVDGVISLTPDVLEDILKIIGPVDLSEKYGVIIDENNFENIIQEIVEVIGQPEVYEDKELATDILSRVATSTEENNIEIEEEKFLRHEPKKIIGDLMSEILNKIFNNVNKNLIIELTKVAEENLNEKNILLYFSDSNLQTQVENRSWAGEMKKAPFDYLSVINSNIAGEKTDKVVNNNMSLSVKIMADGSIINKLTIKRYHSGQKGDLFTGVRNVNWMRIYVPLGSTLIKARGFSSVDQEYFKKSEDFYEKNEILENSENKAEIDLYSQTKIYQEAGKTVFANWILTDPGQEEIVEIEYKLPYNFKTLFPDSEPATIWNFFNPDDIIKKYSLLWQKQSGNNNDQFDFNLNNELELKPFWTYPENKASGSDEIKFSEKLLTDKYLTVIFK
jgi:hypothetical protein